MAVNFGKLAQYLVQVQEKSFLLKVLENKIKYGKFSGSKFNLSSKQSSSFEIIDKNAFELALLNIITSREVTKNVSNLTSVLESGNNTLELKLKILTNQVNQ